MGDLFTWKTLGLFALILIGKSVWNAVHDTRADVEHIRRQLDAVMRHLSSL